MIRLFFASIVSLVALLVVGCHQGDHDHDATAASADGESSPRAP